MASKMFVSLKDKKVDESAEHLGGKGAGLYWMASQGLPIPHAVILPTPMCAEYEASPESTMKAIAKELSKVKAEFKKEFGYMPLLSVRSGARVSMPGMMDTILNVGIDDTTFNFWKEKLGEECVEDSTCRLIEMYGSVVKGIPRHDFEGLSLESRLEVYGNATGEDFPDADGQLLGSIEAVFNSWGNERAQIYRELNNIPHDWGTAVVIQAMVFGNLNNKSCTGVLFTRNPDSGQAGVLGEYLINAQGEDVVAGIRTPDPISYMEKWDSEVYSELMHTVAKLEEAKQDMQDVEFTVQDSKLYILQTRNAKRSARAAVKLALEFHAEGLSRAAALKRVTAKQFDLAQQAVIDPTFQKKPDFVGIPACSGVVTGTIVLSSAAAINCTDGPCILVTAETTPDDIGGMNAAIGVLTMTGGATSHAAVVARGMDKPCVVGLSQDISHFKKGQKVSIDGATGRVWLCEVPVVDGSSNPDIANFRLLMRKYAEAHLITNKPGYAGQQLVRIPELNVLPAAEALAILGQVLKDAAGQPLIIDLNPVLDPHELNFFQPFLTTKDYAERSLRLLKGLELALKGVKHKVTVLTCYSSKLPRLVGASSLSELILAEKGAEMVWSGEATPEVQKVMEWQIKDGIKLVSFGVLVQGGYVTERQLIAELLS